MAGAVFGEVQLSLFVVGAAFGEVRNDSRGRELLFFRYKMLVARRRVFSRIMLGSWSDRPRIVNDVSAVFEKFRGNFGESFFVAGAISGDVGG